MSQDLITNVNNTSVYYINDGQVPFYISIPNAKQVSIVINLIDNPDEINGRKVGLKDITSKITDIYKLFRQDNIAVVTPLIEGAFMDKIKENAEPNYTSYLNKVLGYLINKSYSTLKQNGKEVFQQIKLNNNESYKSFNEKFTSMYPERIQLAKYDIAPVNLTNQPTNINVATLTPPTEPLANTINIALEDTKEELSQNNKHVKTLKREPGFVSYVLLGVIVAILSLIGLYLLL
ncbi:MAG: hypothetical protein IJI49_05205 [Bacilli bacterium]|nr:hypothetical protein [Bacilli bacterium]